MSRSRMVFRSTAISFPRVSGDEPFTNQLQDGLDQFSPRERG